MKKYILKTGSIKMFKQLGQEILDSDQNFESDV